MSDVISINKNKSQYEQIQDIIGHDVKFVIMIDDPNEENVGMSVQSNATEPKEMSYFVTFLAAINTAEIIDRLSFGGEE